jgi:hypothetical protein
MAGAGSTTAEDERDSVDVMDSAGAAGASLSELACTESVDGELGWPARVTIGEDMPSPTDVIGRSPSVHLPPGEPDDSMTEPVTPSPLML